MNSETTLAALLEKLSNFPFHWDGKDCILELKKADFQWKQMEWMGFYFEYLCNIRLQPPFEIPGPKYGRVKFDAFWNFPWDFKAHSATNRVGAKQHQVIVNDKTAIHSALAEYGKFGLIVAICEAKFNDEDRAFKVWHDELKGEQSDYERDRIQRGAPSRYRKVSLDVCRYSVFVLDSDSLAVLRSLNQGRNSNANPRKPKYQIDLRKMKPVGEVSRSSRSI